MQLDLQKQLDAFTLPTVSGMMTAREVADFLGLHENWVYDQAASGRLPSYKIGGTRRFRREELEEWLAAQREPERPTPEKRRRPERPRRRADTQASLFGG